MEEKNKWKYVWIAIISVVCVAVAWWYLFVNLPGSIRQNGGVEALFTGLAFALLIVTAIMQRDELELQRRELRDTRSVFEQQQEQMEGQKEQLRIQNETLKQQQFEATFFQMLSLHNEIVKGITLHEKSGRECFDVLFTRCLDSIDMSHQKWPDKDTKEIIKSGYRDFFYYDESRVGHYFRNLYNIVKYVDRSDTQDRKFYTNLIRAQLSGKELGLLFYNCLSEYGEDKAKPLVERYSLLHNISEDTIPLELRDLYRKIAFGLEKLNNEELERFPGDNPEDYVKIKPRIDEEIRKRAQKKDKAQRGETEA